MDGQNQPPPAQAQILITTPQIAAPMPIAVSSTRSINLIGITRYEPVEFDELDDKGKATGQTRIAPCIFYADGEAVELTEEENKHFRAHWNLLLRNTQFQFTLIAASIPQPVEPVEAQTQIAS